MFLTDSDKTIIKKELYEFIDTKCIFRCNPVVKYSESCEEGHIPSKYPSKENSTFQFYLRRLTHDYKMLNYVCALFVDDIFTNIKKELCSEHFQLCGLETSSIPLITGIQMYAAKYKIGINAFTIRKERKSYGIFNLIDGIPTDAPVIVIDDLLNSGNSISHCLDACKYELLLRPAEITYSIIKMNSNVNQFKFHDNIININSIFTKDEFDYDYNPEKYWLPKDCDRTINKRSEYI